MKQERLKIRTQDMYQRLTKEELEILMAERRKGRIGHKSPKDYKRREKHRKKYMDY